MKSAVLGMLSLLSSWAFAAPEFEVYKCDQFLKNGLNVSIVTTSQVPRGWENYFVKVATTPRPGYEKLSVVDRLPNGTFLHSKSFEVFVTFVPDQGNQSMAKISLQNSNLNGTCY